MPSRKFTKEFMQNLVSDDHSEDAEIIEDNIVDTSRWSEIHDIIFSWW